tara:strand:- start:635 stop:817 length:183 start_codon:yes stop_codon:yes gene_type:complete
MTHEEFLLTKLTPKEADYVTFYYVLQREESFCSNNEINPVQQKFYWTGFIELILTGVSDN